LGQRKWIAFFWAALATLRRLPYLDIRLMTAQSMFSGRTPFVFIGNNHYRMEGLHFGSRDSLREGELSVGIARYRIGRVGLLKAAFRALFGGARRDRDLELFRSGEVHITSRRKRVAVSLDGAGALAITGAIPPGTPVFDTYWQFFGGDPAAANHVYSASNGLKAHIQ
jgi:diacylglycerol kinase family enzyme